MNNKPENDTVLTPEQRKALLTKIYAKIDAQTNEEVYKQLSPADITALKKKVKQLKSQNIESQNLYNHIKRFFYRLIK